MDKESIHKEGKGISPMTPCRPVGLRRKHSGVKNLHSPFLNPIKTCDTSSPISVHSGLMKARLLTNEIAPGKSIQVCSPESGVTQKLNEFGDNNSKKRKSTTSLSKRFARRMLHDNSASSATNTKSLKRNLSTEEEITGLGSNDCGITSSESDIAVRHETAVSQLYSPIIRVTSKQEGSVVKENISDAEINTLREQIADKEKRLKELELAALYKKKHNHEQVAKEIECWLQGCKEALYALQSELAQRNQSYSLHELLKNLGIPPSLLELEEDSE